MKKHYLAAVLTVAFVFTGCVNQNSAELKSGDIVFQTSQSAQSKAIKLATHSKYTHLGIIIKKNGDILVFHAVNPVRYTPLKEWIEEGEGGHYVIKRPKKIVGNWAAAESVIKQMNNRPYDKYFGWGDDKIYCSELVWKIYKRAFNYELCGLRKMKEFDFSSPLVKKMMKQRYGDKIPLDEPVVAPSDIFESKELRTITEM